MAEDFSDNIININSIITEIDSMTLKLVIIKEYLEKRAKEFDNISKISSSLSSKSSSSKDNRILNIELSVDEFSVVFGSKSSSKSSSIRSSHSKQFSSNNTIISSSNNTIISSSNNTIISSSNSYRE
jgi:hypothetical protein